ncbi:MAG: hypothetical protein U0103_08575 [Candidatus Obscuribacterales bacterium]
MLIPRQADGEIVTLNLWGNRYKGIDQGKEIAAWLSHQLGLSCRLLKKLTVHEQASRRQRITPDSMPLLLTAARFQSSSRGSELSIPDWPAL